MPVLELTSSERKKLRGLAHALRPLVQLGQQGLSGAVLAQIERELAAHELVKVKLKAERAEKTALLAEVADTLGCAVAGVVGHVAILFRPHPDPEQRRITFDRS